MRLKSAALAIAVSLLSCAAHAQQAAPNAKAILEGARMAASLTHLDDGLSGNLKKDGKTVPITVFLKGKDIQFQFSETKNVWQGYHMRLNDNAIDLLEVVNQKTIPFPEAKLSQPIAGTDVTYEDLSLRFFYWPDPQLLGVENVGTYPCFKLRVNKPKDAVGRYASVIIWVHQKFGAFMKIQGLDAKGMPTKEFLVQDVMPITDKIWSLKKMQIATLDPANGGRRLSITNLVFESPRKTKPRGAH